MERKKQRLTRISKMKVVEQWIIDLQSLVKVENGEYYIFSRFYYKITEEEALKLIEKND